MRAVRRGAMPSLFILAALACGGDKSPTKPPSEFRAALAVVAGDQQADTVTRMLATPIEVLVTQSATGARRIQHIDGLSLATVPAGSAPAVGQLVRFKADDGCGEAYVGYGLTDSTGRARDRWTLGTKAGPCRLVTIGINPTTSLPEAYDTAYATALPGAADTLRLAGRELLMFVGQPYPVRSLVTRAADRYGNAVPLERLTASSGAGLALSGGNAQAASEGWYTLNLGLDAVRDSVTVAALDDLSAHQWTLTWRCTGWKLTDSAYAPAPDSEAYVQTSRAVVYRDGTAPRLGATSAPVRVDWHMVQTVWWPDSTQVLEGPPRFMMDPIPMPLVQSPDGLHYDQAPTIALTRTGTAPLRYTATHSWCDTKRWTIPLGMTTMTASP